MPKAVRTLIASLLFVVTTAVPAARADWMNLTGAENAPNIAEITVLEDKVRVVLEVYVGDLATFEALLPDDWLKKDVVSRPSLAAALRRDEPASHTTHRLTLIFAYRGRQYGLTLPSGRPDCLLDSISPWRAGRC